MRAVRAVLGTLGLTVSLASPVLAASRSAPVLSLSLSGVVDPFEADYLSSNIGSARDLGAQAVLITIDTPGGLDSSMRKITQAILNSPVPVICFVSPEGARAASAGTFIMQACGVAAMAPGTNIGAAHPVGVAGAIEQKKVTNDAVAYIRSLAEARGRNADWAERAVRQAVSASAPEALRLHVIDLIAPDVPALMRTIDGRSVDVAGGTAVLHTAGAPIESRKMGLGASILHSLLSPDFAFLFFYAGLILVVAGFLHHPVAGLFGAILLVAAFVSFGELPVQLIGIVLLLASAVFFLLELKHPGFGLPTTAGTACLVLGGLFLFNPHVPNARVSLWTILPVAALAVLFFGIVIDKTLQARRRPQPHAREQLIGKEGLVTTALDPNGVVQLAAERWSAVTEGDAVPAGTRVRVVDVEGLKLKVEPLPERAPSVSSGEGGST